MWIFLSKSTKNESNISKVHTYIDKFSHRRTNKTIPESSEFSRFELALSTLPAEKSMIVAMTMSSTVSFFFPYRWIVARYYDVTSIDGYFCASCASWTTRQYQMPIRTLSKLPVHAINRSFRATVRSWSGRRWCRRRRTSLGGTGIS